MNIQRIIVLRVLVMSLFVALIGRLFVMQIVTGDDYIKIAQDGRQREIVEPAVRGFIMDQNGRILAGNQSTIVVSISKQILEDQEDNGESVLKKLAPLLNTTAETLAAKLTICGTEGAAKPPVCWNGSYYQPIPVAENVTGDMAVRIKERRSEFPGVSAEISPVRTIPAPLGVNLAHVLGYLGPVNDTELEERNGTDQELQRTDLIGRAGVEATYDQQLRGVPGVTALSIDRAMTVIDTISQTKPVPGSHVILTVDAALQRVVEDELYNAILRARTQGFAGDSGAAVVVDVTDGSILAMASYPTYDPALWLDGVTDKEYKQLTADSSNAPLISRVTQGLFAPASTFKVITTAAAAAAKLPMGSTKYACPSQITIGDRTMTNYESNSYGDITVARALEVSCNTVFYKIGYDMWLKDGGNTPRPNTADYIETAAKAFGLGKKTGIDLPSEYPGRVGGRAFKIARYEQYKDLWCQRGEYGYPDIEKTDPQRAAYLKLLAQENCVDGGRFRGGDAANLSIGQGDTVATPLQMAMAYAAIANGGTLWRPHVVKAIAAADGSSYKVIKPKKNGSLPVTQDVRKYIVEALKGVVTDGSAMFPFTGWPQSKVAVAAKTGSGQAGNGKDSTSWFASFAPANSPRYAVVMMVSQGGTGSLTSGPSVRKIYEAIFGVEGTNVRPANSVLAGGLPASTLPKIGKDGAVATNEGTDRANKNVLKRYGRTAAIL